MPTGMCHQKFLLFPFSVDILCNALQVVLRYLFIYVGRYCYWASVVCVCVKFSILTAMFPIFPPFLKSFTIFGRNSILSFPHFYFHSLQHLGTIFRCVHSLYMLFFFVRYTQLNITNLFNWCELNVRQKPKYKHKRKKNIRTHTCAQNTQRPRRQINFIGHWLNVNSIYGK